MKIIYKLLIVFLCFSSLFLMAFKPKKVTCIAPAATGGGWDFTCRVPAALVMPKLDLISGRIRVINMSGGGGAIAYAHVVVKQKKNKNLIVAASTATATRLAQNAYSGFTENDVRWLGALGADYGVLAVKKNSKIKNLKNLVAMLKKNPRALKFSGGGSVGGWDHLKILLLAEKVGIKNFKTINYIPFDSGGQALIELIGNRVDVFSGDTSEVIDQFKSGKVRVLAVMSPERVRELGNTPTAKESGFEVIGANWRAFYAPPGISSEVYNYWVNAIKKVESSTEWQDLREKNGLAPFKSFGDDFEKFVSEQIKKIRDISKDLGLVK